MTLLKFVELNGAKKPVHTFDTFAVDTSHMEGFGFIIGRELVMVDFDKRTKAADQMANLFPTLKVNTDRGFHLYYRKPKGLRVGCHTNHATALGINVDYKTGDKTQGVLKKGGVMRKIENEHYLHDPSALPDLPLLLYPVAKTKQPLDELKEGDGRNSRLFSHLCNVMEQYPKYNKDGNLFKLAHFINQLTFAEPLPDKEMNAVVESVITRDLSNDQLYLDPKDINMTAKYLTDRLHIHRFQGKIYFFNEKKKVFDYETNRLERAIYKYIELEKKEVEKVAAQFHLTSKQVSDDGRYYPLQLGGGYILDQGEPIELEKVFTPYSTTTRYNPDAYDKRTDEFLDFLTCNDKKMRMLVEEILGHVLLTHEFPHKAFFFTGEKGGNGKSTFLEMVYGLVGETLATNVDLKNFDDDTQLATLAGKFVNLGDDIDSNLVEKSGNFKSLVSGDTIMIRPIYKQPYVLINTATLIFTCNDIPKFKDRTGGLARRIVVVPCDNSLPESEFDLTLKDHLRLNENSRSYVLNLAIEGIKRLRANKNTFTRVPRSEAATKEYLLDNDLVGRYFNEMGDEITIEGKDVNTCYTEFVNWCTATGENGWKVNKASFGKAVKKYTGLTSKLKRINGGSFRVYVKPDESN